MQISSFEFTLSLKAQLLLSITLIMFIGLMIGTTVILHNAREAVAAEIDSSFTLAQELINSDPGRNRGAISKIHTFPNSLVGLRHLQVIIEHQYQDLSLDKNIDIEGVPTWFVRNVYPQETLQTKMIVHGRGTEKWIIAADPADEIQEVWEDVRDLLLLTSTLFFTSLVLIYFSIRRGLQPLKILQHGFEHLENDQLDIRITEDTVPELSQLHHSFNHMVETLQKTTQEKTALSRKLVTLQEDERTHIARELHDEVGPYLFSLRVTNRNLKNLYHSDRNNTSAINNYITSIDETTEQLQLCIKHLLKLLRPMSLNDLSLNDALHDLVETFKTTDPSIQWQLDNTIDIELNDILNVTIYRIIQESLTNIGRHSQATKAIIRLSISHLSDKKSTCINILVSDDGIGVGNNQPTGFGLVGIKERIEVLGGHFEQSTDKIGLYKGACISVQLPIVHE